MLISQEQREQLRNRLRAEGVTLSVLCRDNNISYQAARDLLCGKGLGWRGDRHRAAVFLGLKPDPKTVGTVPEKLAA